MRVGVFVLGLVACGGSSSPPRAPTEPAPAASTASASATSEPAKPATPPATSDAPDDDEARLQEALRSIREISPLEHAVSRKAADAVLESQGALLRSARFVPFEQNGKVVGFRVFGVRPDGLLGRLGFQNGDRIERVLGKPITTPEQALDFYGAARTAKVIDVDLVRAGAPARLLVRIDP